MNFIKKLLRDDDDLYDERYTKEMSEDEIDESIDNIPATELVAEEKPVLEEAGVSLRVMRPKSYDDGPEIADYVAGGCTVVMNIEDLNRENSRRLIDFLLGAVHVIGGDLKMASQTTFVVSPNSIEVSDLPDGDEKTPGGFSFR